jgi:hypothetical protein
MSVTATPSEDKTNAPFRLNVAVTKVDKETRMVTGAATAEVVDKGGQIIDYATVKKFFQDKDLWPGNIREMHQPKAVGKAVSVEFDDDNKLVMLTSRVSKGAPETWEKVLDGTLSMYSIGGSGDIKVEKADGKTVERVFMTQLAEVSLVDNGANPLSRFEIVKSVDGEIVGVQPAEPDELDAAVLDKRQGLLDAVTKFVGSDIAKNAPKAASLASVVLTAVQKMAVVEDIEKGYPEPYDIDRALGVISGLEWLIASEFYDVDPSNPNPTKSAQVVMLKNAAEWVMNFVFSEHAEQFSEMPNADAEGSVEEAAVALATAATNILKAGARHSAKDQKLVQDLHENACALGASCATETVEKSLGTAAAAKAKGYKG